MGTDLDVIGAIEAAYDVHEDDDAWLSRIVHAIGPSFGGGGAPISAFSYAFDSTGRMTMGAFASAGKPAFTREQYERQQSVASPQQLRSAFDCDMFTLLSRVVGEDNTRDGMRKAAMDGADSLGLRANVDPNRGVIVTTVVPERFRIRNRTLWLRLASHVGAALRLRHARKSAGPDGAAAILTPDGKLAHATARTHAARVDLARAVKRIDRARGKLRRLDPDEASSVWRAMVRGEWSLVDWFDHDQKRFLVAHDNHVVPSKATPKLSAREHQVAACAAMGHSNKLIAYDLGLSTGTVSVVLSRAAAKLGVTNRPALIRAVRELGTAGE